MCLHRVPVGSESPQIALLGPGLGLRPLCISACRGRTGLGAQEGAGAHAAGKILPLTRSFGSCAPVCKRCCVAACDHFLVAYQCDILPGSGRPPRPVPSWAFAPQPHLSGPAWATVPHSSPAWAPPYRDASVPHLSLNLTCPSAWTACTLIFLFPRLP